MSNKKFNSPQILTQTAKRKPQLILSGFGLQALKTKIYNFGEEEADDPKDDAFDILPISYLGTPVFSNLDIEGGSYKNFEGKQIPYDPIVVNTALFDVSQSRNIIKTQIQGRNGTTKEYISDGDFSVTIRGIIASESSVKYPEEEVRKLLEVCKVQKSIEINSRLLTNVFGVTNLVIESYAFPQEEGFQNIQLFELNCVSDDPIELTIND